MGILKKAADLAYTFRFIRMLVMSWENWDAHKLGIIDENGKRNKNVQLDTSEKKDAYTPFIRLCANVKRLIEKIPGGGSKLGSFAAALYLIKEEYNLKDKDIEHILKKCDIDMLDFIKENNEWFVLQDKQLTPGIYKIKEDKLINNNYFEVNSKDSIRILDNSYPIGEIFGYDIYEGIHINTNQSLYLTSAEIYK
tara:strand:+ start:688 stop:1272 length:585 start_codon:yes stop_codon:yes gene_type:complete